MSALSPLGLGLALGWAPSSSRCEAELNYCFTRVQHQKCSLPAGECASLPPSTIVLAVGGIAAEDSLMVPHLSWNKVQILSNALPARLGPHSVTVFLSAPQS